MGRPALASREAFEDTQQGEALDDKRQLPSQAFIGKTRADLSVYLADSGKTQSDVARGVRLSATVISQFIAGKYAGAGANIAKRIAAYLTVEAQRAIAPRDPTWVLTENAKALLTMFDQCRILCDFGIAYGAAGTGKTKTAQRYKQSNPDTILVHGTLAIRRPRAFLRHLAELDGVDTPSSGATDALFKGVLSRLRDSGRLIIVDEAQLLDYGALEMLRRLHDLSRLKADGGECVGVGVVLLGNEVIWRVFHEGRSRSQYDQVISRTAYRRCLEPGFPPTDVEAVARQYIDGADGECIAYLVKQAGGVGGLRSVVKICRMAFTTVADPSDEHGGRAVTVQDLEAAKYFMEVGRPRGAGR